MAAKATIPLIPADDGLFWTDLTSEKIELAGFEWHVTGQAEPQNSRIASISIDCTPVAAKKTFIWNCEVHGQIMLTGYQLRNRYEAWSHSFNFRSSSSPNIKEIAMVGYDFNCAVVHLNVLSHDLIDLSVPDNRMIQSSDDAAQVTVEGETLWLSKSILGGHSLFFKTLFNSDFKEKLTGIYELKEIVLEEFLHFISLVYGLKARIDYKSVEYLLKMADYFQCDLVINQCCDFLYKDDQLPSVKKLQLADRYGFFDVVFKLVQTMGSANLKICAAECGFSLHTTELLLKCLGEVLDGLEYNVDNDW